MQIEMGHDRFRSLDRRPRGPRWPRCSLVALAAAAGLGLGTALGAQAASEHRDPAALVLPPVGSMPSDLAVRNAPGPDATLAEIEACATRNLPDAAGVIEFRVDAIDRSGDVITSRAQIRWRQDEDARSRILLRVSEPARTAGTALLIIDRDQGQPEFFVRLPDHEKVRRVRSSRLRGPVLGTDFSYEDLDRLREPLDRTALELVGTSVVEGRAVWILETIPDEDDRSEYTRVLTYVDQEHCLPARIDLFQGEGRLRKRLDASLDRLRQIGEARVPERFVMQDHRRGTRTVVRIERLETSPDLPAEQFTKRALSETLPAATGH